MAELLKDQVSPAFIKKLAQEIVRHHPPFPAKKFTQGVLDKNWEKRALKDRIAYTAESLHLAFAQNFRKATDILLLASPAFHGLPHLVFPTYIELFGREDFALSMNALEKMTPQSSAEFAIRPFILQDPVKTMKKMRAWSTHPNEHVRRLASEGCRPRLPWASALPAFKKDPQPILPILRTLRDDPSLYVRKSVANNLNDISKDHPALLLQLAQDWIGQSPRTDWILKHGCRTLLKQGNRDALALFSLPPPKHVSLKEFSIQPKVAIGESLVFSFHLKTSAPSLGLLRLEYALHFRKKNGETSAKVFKISESTIPSPEKEISKTHSFRPLSTRTYYPGKHYLSVIVNGHVLAKKEFCLV